MKYWLLFVCLSILICSCSTQHYYVVRHAEKETTAPGSAMMNSDPPLSAAGKERAESLKEILQSKKIGYIFSTKYVRTKSTAEPTRAYFKLVTETYSPVPDSVFIAQVRGLQKNVLIVGHSNTVDDIVNKLCGSTQISGDLPETEYDNLFIVTKKGKKYSFERRKYGR